MKWFHHECAAKHDPKLQTLGDEFGAEGLGIYWGLLEEIGQHSDTFHLKVTGISHEADSDLDSLTQGSERLTMKAFPSQLDLKKIPQLSVRLLAKNLFTPPQKLAKVLEAVARIGLFDSAKWLKYNILYSPSFELRADDYTRRQQRRTDNGRTQLVLSPDKVGEGSEQSTDTVRTESEESWDNLRTKSDFVRPEAEQKRTEEEQNSIHACLPGENVDNSCYHACGIGEVDFLIAPTPEQYDFYVQKLRSEVHTWNAGQTNKFDWHPHHDEIRKLFYGGSEQHKLRLCYQAYNINNERVNYPELVLRAVRLVLQSSEKKRIQNPTGWLWSCLHGNGDGTTPWVQLLTADEENSIGNHLSRTISSRSTHPP